MAASADRPNRARAHLPSPARVRDCGRRPAPAPDSVSEFDAYLMVDWSGASVPSRGTDSIWIAHARRDGNALTIHEPLNAPTRALATAHLADVIDTYIALGSRVLVGFDFAFGYPRGFARAQPLDRKSTRLNSSH